MGLTLSKKMKTGKSLSILGTDLVGNVLSYWRDEGHTMCCFMRRNKCFTDKGFKHYPKKANVNLTILRKHGNNCLSCNL